MSVMFVFAILRDVLELPDLEIKIPILSQLLVLPGTAIYLIFVHESSDIFPSEEIDQTVHKFGNKKPDTVEI